MLRKERRYVAIKRMNTQTVRTDHIWFRDMLMHFITFANQIRESATKDGSYNLTLPSMK